MPVSINPDVLLQTAKVISGYRTQAEKIVNNTRTGVVAALERFFHKLEFFLKHNSFPTADDVTGERLPPELQGLKDFLEEEPGEARSSYVLQRNETERYRFSWRDGGELAVSMEKFHISTVAARSGYTGEEWRLCVAPQTCRAGELLSLLKEKGRYEVMEGKAFFNKYSKSLPPYSPEQKFFTADEIRSDNEWLNVTYRNMKESFSDRSFSYFISNKSDSQPCFNTCLVDLPRAISCPLRLGGIEIPREMFGKIISRIQPSGEREPANTEAFAQNEVNELLFRYPDTSLSQEQKIAIRSILQHPQFPLALLAVVTQGVAMPMGLVPLLQQQVVLGNFIGDNNLGLSVQDMVINEYSITADTRSGGLLCEDLQYGPFIGKNTKTEKDGIGMYKALNSFCVPKELGEGKKEHNQSEIEKMLAPLASDIITTITI